ncbi:MAG: 50S ribosomal protein L6 [archaeon]
MEIDIPAGIEVTVEKSQFTVKGPKGKVVRKFSRDIEIKKSGDKMEVVTKGKTADARALSGTFVAHIKNMFNGVQNPYIYKLKVVSVHFPITVTIQNNELLVQNFFGEKRPRKVKLPADVSVKIQGEFITVESVNIEDAGMVATKIEQSTKISNRDRRTFLDGIYMVEKAGVPVTAD